MAETARVRLPIPSGRVALIGGGGLAALIALLVLYATFLTNVGPNEFAVRQVFLGPKKGVQKEILGPGLHFVMPGYERLHLFPREMQLLEFNEAGLICEVWEFFDTELAETLIFRPEQEPPSGLSPFQY